MRSALKTPMIGGLLAAVFAIAACGSASSGNSSTQTQTQTLTSAGAASAKPGAGKPPVTLGTKNFTEELVLGELYAQALRAKGFVVKLERSIGPSEIVARKLGSGEIDGYPEYTGTILSSLAHQSARPATAADAYARAASFERGHGAALLAMAPAEDKDVVVAKPAFAAANGLRSLADIARLGHSATIAAAPEFKTRFNGLIGLREIYALKELRVVPVQIGEQYRMLDAGRTKLAAVFTTDGNLSQGGYALLADPDNIFGFQNVTFVVRQPVLEREGPAFARTIDAVSAKLSTQALRVMNAAVDLDQQTPAAVARQFLGANGLI